MNVNVGVNSSDLELLLKLLPVLIPIFVIQVGLAISAIVSIVKKKLPSRDVVLWILIVVMFSLIGPIVYFAIGSKMLDETKSKYEHGGM